MAKKNKIGTVINELVVDLTPEAMSVWEGKGKKKKMDAEATLENLTVNLAYYKGMFDAFESVVGEIDGLSDAIAEHKESFDTLFAFAKEKFPEDIDNLSEKYAITPFEEADEDEEDEDGDAISLFSSLELSDAKAVAKELGIKVTKKDTVETLAEKLSEEAEEEDIMSTLEEMGYLEDEESEEEESEDDEVEEEEEEDDTPDYSEYGLGDLRKLCKENGIKYTPKEKADDLIAKLDEFYGSEDEEEDEEESSYEDMSLSELRAECKERGIKYTPKEKEADLIAKLVESDSEEEDEEDVTEDELDELLDEEFEDEVLEKEEKATKGTAKKGAKKKGR